eukprot:PhM_4_TR12637/c0_g1_i1/m.87831
MHRMIRSLCPRAPSSSIATTATSLVHLPSTASLVSFLAMPTTPRRKAPKSKSKTTTTISEHHHTTVLDHAIKAARANIQKKNFPEGCACRLYTKSMKAQQKKQQIKITPWKKLDPETRTRYEAEAAQNRQVYDRARAFAREAQLTGYTLFVEDVYAAVHRSLAKKNKMNSLGAAASTTTAKQQLTRAVQVEVGLRWRKLPSTRKSEYNAAATKRRDALRQRVWQDMLRRGIFQK